MEFAGVVDLIDKAHSDRGSQYASEPYRHLLAQHGLVGSMGRRGNPYDNAKAESFMKTLKCLMITAAFEAPAVIAGLDDIAMVGQAD